LKNTSPADQVIDVVNYGNAPDPSWLYYDMFSAYFFDAGTQPTMIPDGAKSIQRWPDGKDNDLGSDFQQIARSPGAASCGDPYESDDTLGTAFLQNSGTTNLHRICAANDNDYISFTASPSFTYTLQATAVGARVDTVLRLYDTSGNLVAEDNPDPSHDSQIRFMPNTAGTYRAQVVDRNAQGGNGPDYLYSFSISQVSAATPTPSQSVTPTPIACEDQYEPDNVFPQEARTLELNTEQVHTFCLSGSTGPDTDWMRFVASAGKVYSFYTKDLSGPTDTLLSLYESDGNKLYQNDDYDPGQGLASRIDWSFTTPGVYYLAAREKRNGNSPAYRYTVGVTTTGELPPTGTPTASPTLSPFSPTPTTGPCDDAYEPDGVPEAARLFYIGQTQQHSICPEGDADWVRFYARAGKEYTISTANLGIGLDTYMWLFDSDGQTILAYNDDGGNGVASRIDFFPSVDSYYYVQVKNAGDLGLPSMTYDLSLIVTPGAPQPPGTATGIIAPVLTVTGGPSDEATPTTVVLPTKPPAPTPTQGQIEPTPELPNPPATANPGTGDNEPPTKPPADTPTAVVPTVSVPGIPNTGLADPPLIDTVQQPPAAPKLAPMLFRIFYDRDHNDSFSVGEGIRGVNVYFLDVAANLAPAGSLTTSAAGDGTLNLPTRLQRIYIPYLGVNMPLTRFPERESHSLWLPPVQLPERVP
ncbi:MAG TPA: pre-peptidase C-terminal domain-containing protein, partial [Chloroflexia bacterium]|nr:pre-peptidase C-terminal domain-containing protein [Chloroflexia bacterium]